LGTRPPTTPLHDADDSNEDIFDGWVIFLVWKMAESPKIFYTGIWPLARDQPVDPNSDTWMNVSKISKISPTIQTSGRQLLAADRNSWREVLKSSLRRFESGLIHQVEERRLLSKGKSLAEKFPSSFTCQSCHRDCHSCIGLYNHQ
jgi:hypothetical protein